MHNKDNMTPYPSKKCNVLTELYECFMYIHIHILSDIVQRFKVKKIHVDLLFVPVEIKDHFSFQISQKMKLSNDPGKVESNFFCYAAIRITYLRI